MMSFHGAKDLLEGVGFALVVGTAIGLALEVRTRRLHFIHSTRANYAPCPDLIYLAVWFWQGEISSGGILTLAMLYNKASQPLQKMHGVVSRQFAQLCCHDAC